MTLYPLLLGGGFFPVQATGGTISTVTIDGKSWQRHTFSTVGSNQFIITSRGNYGYVDVIMWGAGGGGGYTGGGGGAGAYVRNSNLSISEETLNVCVGGGGRYGGQNSNPGTGGTGIIISGTNYGFGGKGSAAGSSGGSSSGGGGGAASLILRGTTFLVAAGAGAGGGGVESGATGGGGGGSNQDGEFVDDPNNPGTSLSGTAGSQNPISNGEDGTGTTSGDFSAGGGGAGGLYGGGAGRRPGGDRQSTGGGGGGTNLGPTVTNGTTGSSSGTAGVAGNSTDPLNNGVYGNGGAKATSLSSTFSGKQGIVYIQYPLQPL